MASGINVEGLDSRVLIGLSKAQLDFQLMEYYKLLATLHIQSKNVDEANKALRNYWNLIHMIDPESPSDREQEMIEMAKNLDKLHVSIDPECLKEVAPKIIFKKQKRK